MSRQHLFESVDDFAGLLEAVTATQIADAVVSAFYIRGQYAQWFQPIAAEHHALIVDKRLILCTIVVWLEHDRSLVLEAFKISEVLSEKFIYLFVHFIVTDLLHVVDVQITNEGLSFTFFSKIGAKRVRKSFNKI